MAFAFTVKAGDFFTISGERIDVVAVNYSVTLRRAAGSVVLIEPDEHLYELMPEVWVGIGHRSQKTIGRLSIDAPRHIKIVRGVLSK
jgi:hypothetical protein